MGAEANSHGSGDELSWEREQAVVGARPSGHAGEKPCSCSCMPSRKREIEFLFCIFH